MTQMTDQDATRFVSWMLAEVVADGRGDHMETLPVAPKGRLWLGRLAPQVVVENSRLGDRAERLEPCEVGVRVRPNAIDGRTITCRAQLAVWGAFDGGDAPDAPRWRKSPRSTSPASWQRPRQSESRHPLGDPSLSPRCERPARTVWLASSTPNSKWERMAPS